MDSTIKDFVKKTIEEIHSGLPDGYEISDEIKFNISLITTTNKKGGVNIKIATGDIDKEKQTIHNIIFEVVNPKKKQENINQTGAAVISFINQGISALASISTELPQKQKLIQEEVQVVPTSKKKK